MAKTAEAPLVPQNEIGKIRSVSQLDMIIFSFGFFIKF